MKRKTHNHPKARTWLSRLLLTVLVIGGIDLAAAKERVVYYHNDPLGSPIAASDESGNLLWQEDYAPYGERLRREDQGKDIVWYTGKEEDPDLGLYYYGARWYAPEIGRFLEIDPVGFDEGNPQSFNRYAYANNNPYKFVDPDGKLGFFALVVYAIGIATYSGYANAPAPGEAARRNSTLQMAATVVPPVKLSRGFGSGLGAIPPEIAEAADVSTATKSATSLSPASIRFSQSSVNGVEEIAASMRASGWQGAPIDVVRMSDGALTTFDNTRVLAAQRAGINVEATIREAGEAFPPGRWTPKSGVQPATWEDAVQVRIQQQNRGFRTTYPNGSPYTGSAQ